MVSECCSAHRRVQALRVSEHYGIVLEKNEQSRMVTFGREREQERAESR